MDTPEHTRLLDEFGARKLLMESPGFHTFKDHCHRFARGLYLQAVAGEGSLEIIMAQARVVHHLLESFELETVNLEEVLHQERLVNDQQYRQNFAAREGEGRARPFRARLDPSQHKET